MPITPFFPTGLGLTPVTQNTTAENLDPSLRQPYDYLNGGSTGSPSQNITDGANAVFPQTDGSTAVLQGPIQKPDSYNSPPAALGVTGQNPSVNFAIWPTVYQRSYILEHDPSGVPPTVTIGGSTFQVIDNSGRVTRDGTLLQYSTGAATRPSGYNILPQSLDLNSPDPGLNFLKWHSSFQVEYLLENKTSSNPATLQIGSGAALRTIFLSASSVKVYFVEDLQKADIAKMPLADQQALAAIPAFQTVANRLGLTTAVASLLTVINTATTKVNATANLTADQKKIYTDELANVATRLNGGAVASIKDVNDAVTDITKRFDVLNAYGAVANGITGQATTEAGTTGSFNIISSTGNNDAIVAGFNKMLAQEKQILNVDNARLQVAKSTGGGQKQLDAPNLVFLFQLEYNLKDEAKLTFQTEEVNQQNLLLQSYGKMQQIVNQTIGAFGNSDSKQKLKLEGKANLGEISSADYAAIYMFEDLLSTGRPAKINGQHPFEVLNSIPRPFFDTIINNTGELNEFLQSQWSSFGTQLSDAVSAINQQTQILMNDINTLTKQKDRHFDLANNALAKAAEIAQSIGRNLN